MPQIHQATGTNAIRIPKTPTPPAWVAWREAWAVRNPKLPARAANPPNQPIAHRIGVTAIMIKPIGARGPLRDAGTARVVDIAPTVLALLGIDGTAPVDGHVLHDGDRKLRSRSGS